MIVVLKLVTNLVQGKTVWGGGQGLDRKLQGKDGGSASNLYFGGRRKSVGSHGRLGAVQRGTQNCSALFLSQETTYKEAAVVEGD